MALTLALLDTPRGPFMGDLAIYYMTAKPSSSSAQYVTNGDTLDFTTLPLIKSSRAPVLVEVINIPSGYSAEAIQGTAMNNSKIVIYSAQGTQVAAATYPAALGGGASPTNFSPIIIAVYVRLNT